MRDLYFVATRYARRQNMRVYLDYAAATPLDKQVKSAMDKYLAGSQANPSGLYQEGRVSKKELEASRQTVASFIGAHAHEIVFTSSTTEANNLAILGVARANRQHGWHLITTAVEHVSVLNVFKQLEKEGFKVTYLPVNQYGQVFADQVKSAIRPDTILVSVIFANNEIGTINPIKEIGKGINRGKGNKGLPYFHSDAAQAAPHLRINAHELGLDLMSFSASKIYGPKGAAALYIKSGLKIEPIMLGGSQENSLRPGTQDLVGIVGFAKAIEIVKSSQKKEELQFLAWRDKIIKEVQKALPEVILNGHPRERLTNNINFSIIDVKGEELVLGMDQAGFAISTRSACDAHHSTPPHVIKALGRTDAEAWGAVRITLGRQTTSADVNRFIKIFISEIKKLKARLRSLASK